MRLAATTPLPRKFNRVEAGLMTVEEYIKAQNKQGKYHLSETWDYTVESFNRNPWYPDRTYKLRRGDKVTVGKHLTLPNTWVYETLGKVLVAVLHDEVLYHSLRFNPREFPLPVGAEVRSYSKVKYLDREWMPRLDTGSLNYKKDYPVLLRRVEAKGEWFEFRKEKDPKERTISVFHVGRTVPLRVGRVSDEWGATLLAVAREYRGYGLGALLKAFWSKFSPHHMSGGFTQGGEETARKFWARRVREFLSNGWYSQLIKRGDLTTKRVQEIMKGLPGRSPFQGPFSKRRDAPPKKKQGTGKIVAYTDNQAVVILYDPAYLKDRDPVHIKGYALMRESGKKLFFFAVDWDRGYEAQISRAAVQLHLDSGGGPLWVNSDTYTDMWDPHKVPGAKVDGDYAEFTKRNVYPLRRDSLVEKALRRKLDPYQETLYKLMEDAESKWR